MHAKIAKMSASAQDMNTEKDGKEKEELIVVTESGFIGVAQHVQGK